jgi:hypothetical protein
MSWLKKQKEPKPEKKKSWQVALDEESEADARALLEASKEDDGNGVAKEKVRSTHWQLEGIFTYVFLTSPSYQLKTINSTENALIASRDLQEEPDEIQCALCDGERPVQLFCETCSQYWCSLDFCSSHTAPETTTSEGTSLDVCKGLYRPLPGESLARLPVGSRIGGEIEGNGVEKGGKRRGRSRSPRRRCAIG